MNGEEDEDEKEEKQKNTKFPSSIHNSNLFHFNFDAYKLGKSLHYIRFILALFRMNIRLPCLCDIYTQKKCTNDRGLPQNYARQHSR